jgi:hypothetical protein
MRTGAARIGDAGADDRCGGEGGGAIGRLFPDTDGTAAFIGRSPS